MLLLMILTSLLTGSIGSDSCIEKSLEPTTHISRTFDVDSMYNSWLTVVSDSTLPGTSGWRELLTDKLQGLYEYGFLGVFWTEICRKKGMSRCLLSVEFNSSESAFGGAVLFQSKDKFYFAKWSAMKTGYRHPKIDYAKIDRLKVERLLRHIDTCYHPLLIKSNLLGQWPQVRHATVWVTASYCGRSNSFVMPNVQEPALNEFEDLFEVLEPLNSLWVRWSHDTSWRP